MGSRAFVGIVVAAGAAVAFGGCTSSASRAFLGGVAAPPASTPQTVAPRPAPPTHPGGAVAPATSAQGTAPVITLQTQAATRARAYVEACATDTAFVSTWRALSDSIAWMECGSRATAQDPFGPTPFDRVRQMVGYGCFNLGLRDDSHPPDFDANDLLRLMYLYPTASTPGSPSPKNRLPVDVSNQIHDALIGFKYWIDEGGPDNICFWSENHQIQFASVEYLAGQLLPNETFTNSGMRGVDHKAKARIRVLRWLDERLKFGFSEWNSPGYYEEDLRALFNLVDFCDDPLVQKRASMVLDVMVFDLARFTENGSFGVTSGRCYEKIGGDFSKWKSTGWQQSVGELIEILFGTRGRYSGPSSPAALSFATSTYQVPAVLLSIGQDRPGHFIDRSRVSVDFAEGPTWGIGFNGLADGMFWWGHAGYMTKDTIANTRQILRSYGVTNMQANIQDALGFAYPVFQVMTDQQLRDAADLASPITEGMCLTKANLYTYRNQDAMLSSVQNYRAGQIGPQQQIWQATLGMTAVVWGSLPGKREADGPGYWTGNAAMPCAVQNEGAVIVGYDAPLITQVSQGLYRTHAWFPEAEFDEVDQRRGSNLQGAFGVTSNGTWLFGRKGDGYVALYSNQGYDAGSGPIDWVSSGSWQNVYICQVGNKTEFGSFAAFKDQVTRARVYVHYPNVFDSSPVYCGYDQPGKGRLEMTYGQNPSVNGAVVDVSNFPRFDNPYATTAWGQGTSQIQQGGFALTTVRDADPQNPTGDVRTGDGVH